ncbi:MAG: WecB/TagA/CpsF family glycosyltransferase [Planctomycetota bacterium]
MLTTPANSDLPRPIEVVGLPIRPFDMNGLIDAAISRAKAGTRTFACYANAHTVNLACADDRYRRALTDCDLLYCDGASVVWASRFAERRLPCRITAMDYFPVLAQRCAADGLSMFLLGSQDGTAEKAAAALRTVYPNLKIVGTHTGHFDLTRSDEIITKINAAAPDCLAVGMSSPRQELWLADHGHKINAPLHWCVGALFDYLAGRERRAPQWLCRLGLEWLFRLAMDPIGKSRRYLVGNPKFIWNTLRWRMKQSSHTQAQSINKGVSPVTHRV